MKKRVGKYITQRTAKEPFKAYVPAPLPPPLDMDGLYTKLEQAMLALAELNALAQSIPNTSLFLYMYIRKEALLSSQIEGTQSSFSDLILFENNQPTPVELGDVEEVANYIKAIKHGLKRLQNGFPLSLRLLREIHGVLLAGGRGADKLPGEFRRSQNWIGGTRPGNALFVPPPVTFLEPCLADFERFLHEDKLPALIKAGLAHVQFETIHPFLDGNGRLGRLLITLLLCENKLLNAPILYLSLYLKEHRHTYYNLLQEVRLYGHWETWLEFFLEGVTQTSKQAIKTGQQINHLFQQDEAKIAALGRIRFSCQDIFSYLKKLPQVSAPLLEKSLDITAPTARAAIESLVEVGILLQVGERKRNRTYIYRKYLDLLEQGADPISK